MSSPKKIGSTLVVVDVPDIDQVPDERLESLARMRDGKWSSQTKSLLQQFGTAKLDLNRSWASTWTQWSCPCCRREKLNIARLSSGGVLLCRLEFHHDHLADFAERIFDDHNLRSESRETNIQVGRAKTALMLFVERFERTLICLDCNLAEGRAKLDLSNEIDPYFTFTPSEIASFIDVSRGCQHAIDIDRARVAWLAAKGDVADRIDFTKRMAQRIASGRHRREVASGRRLLNPIDDRDLVYSLFSAAAPDDYRHRLGLVIEARSTANDSAGHSPKPKRRTKVRPPTSAEFAEIDLKKQSHKQWARAGSDWTCPCCNRSKLEICRRSNSGLWTAHIHRVYEFEPEDRYDSLILRRRRASSDVIIGSHRHIFVCQDCRNVVSEVLRRATGLSENIFTLADLRLLVGSAAPHTTHNIDFDQAINVATGNKPLLEAIEDYHKHRLRAFATRTEVKRLMTLMDWPLHTARNIVGYDYAKSEDVDLDEGNEHTDWLLEEANRLLALEDV